MKKKKPMTAKEMVAIRNKKYGKKWLTANANKMVSARKAKALHLEVCERYKAGFECPDYKLTKTA